MSFENIEKITKTCGTQLMNVNLTGGEPFLRSDLYEIAKAYILNAKVNSVFITTHGGFEERIVKFAEKFKNEFPNKTLIFSFSLDGFEEVHNKIRKVKNLYKKTLTTYHRLQNFSPNILTNIAITVSEFNHENILSFYDHLIQTENVNAVTVTIARDAGVYKTSELKKKLVLEAYEKLTGQIIKDLNTSEKGYSESNYLGRMINAKNKIMYNIVADTYKNDKYIMPCQAGKVLGIIYGDGRVYPCEVLDKPLGDLNDFDYNLMNLWKSNIAKDLTQWIKNTNCHCTFECAWSYNILLNSKYYKDLGMSLL